MCCIQARMSKSSKYSSTTHCIHDSDDSATDSSSSEESGSTTSVEKQTKSAACLEANDKIKACKYVGHICRCTITEFAKSSHGIKSLS